LAGAVEDATPEVQSLAAIADRNANRLALMLDDVAEYWRLNDPATALAPVPTDVVDAGQRAIEQVQTLADERGITLDVQTTPIDATIDPLLVRTAVVRVLSYALRASPRTSTVRVRLGRATVTGDAGADAGSPEQGAEKMTTHGSGVVVSVLDAGSAVDVASAARMFAPFAGVTRAGANLAGRKDLGLAIAMRIAMLHGGSLVFTSTEQGGLFELRLP
jgi:signal transduction histidine kinase